MARVDFRFSRFGRPFAEIATAAREPSDVQSTGAYWYNVGRQSQPHRKAELVSPSPGTLMELRSPRYCRRVPAAICPDVGQPFEPLLFPFALIQLPIRARSVDRLPATRQFRVHQLPGKRSTDLDPALHTPWRRSLCTRLQKRAFSPTVSKRLHSRRSRPGRRSRTRPQPET